jgi:hypothetical protein
MSYEQTKIKPLPLTWETLPKYAKFIAKYGKTPTQYIKEQDEKNISTLRYIDALQFSKLEKNLGSRHNLSSYKDKQDTNKDTNKDKDKQDTNKDKDKQDKNKDKQEEMKTVTYFNTDLQKNVTVKIPAHINIIPQKQGSNKEKDKYVLTLDEKELLDHQDLHSLIDRYGYKATGDETNKYVLTLDEKELLDHQDLYSLIDRYGYKATGGKSKSKKTKSKKSKSKKSKSKKSKDSLNKIKNLIKSGHTLVFNNKDKFSNRQVKQLLQIAINKGDYKRAEMISFLHK